MTEEAVSLDHVFLTSLLQVGKKITDTMSWETLCSFLRAQSSLMHNIKFCNYGYTIHLFSLSLRVCHTLYFFIISDIWSSSLGSLLFLHSSLSACSISYNNRKITASELCQDKKYTSLIIFSISFNNNSKEGNGRLKCMSCGKGFKEAADINWFFTFMNICDLIWMLRDDYLFCLTRFSLFLNGI